MFAASQKSHCVSEPSAAPCAQDQVSRLRTALAASSRSLPRSRLTLSTRVPPQPPPRSMTPHPRADGRTPLSRSVRANFGASAYTRASPAEVRGFLAFPKSLLAHVHLSAPQHTHMHMPPRPSLQAHLLTRSQTDRQTGTPLDRRPPTPDTPVPSHTPQPEPVRRRRVAALLPPRLPGPRLFGLLSGYVAEGSFPLVLPIENKVSLYLMVMADVRRIWQMKRPFALKYCSLRRVSLPTHHDPIFFSGCLTRMTNELIFSVHRWEM